MIRDAIAEVAAAAGRAADAEVEISIPGGEALAAKTLNGRLGIVGGLSILGTTGIVVPYSCSAWIHSIHRGIDVARAAGLTHIAGATGASSEAGGAKALRLARDRADRHGRLRRRHAQISAQASGAARHHRRRRRQDDQAGAGPHRSALQARRGRPCALLGELGRRRPAAPRSLCERIVAANTAAEAFALAQAEGIALGDAVARAAQQTAERRRRRPRHRRRNRIVRSRAESWSAARRSSG